MPGNVETWEREIESRRKQIFIHKSNPNGGEILEVVKISSRSFLSSPEIDYECCCQYVICANENLMKFLEKVFHCYFAVKTSGKSAL